ncbi:MAG TPA: glycoside hydrolase family 9 protein, partial [Spirochaetota bacterium]|nr:glycoside hydrolase family 9 protein [Spirochaetota bacterium]
MKYFKIKKLTAVLAIYTALFSAAVSEQIIVDQLGYRCEAVKKFMIADPQTGFNSGVSYTPGASVQLRRSSDEAIMQTITLIAWNSGAEHNQSGDIVWQGEITNFTNSGTYHIYDPVNDRQSYDFEIKDDVYNALLDASVKTFYYQRCGTAIEATYGGTWHHAACHLQQTNAHLYDNGDQGAGTARDVSGGWHDAGDYRKYVTFTTSVLWMLMHAYEWYPDRFGDNLNIPESGNGVPDILDEVKWELDWLLKMQRNDGALYSGVFVTGSAGGNGDPGTETTTYYYANISTAATGTGAYAFALAARLFDTYDSVYPGYNETLKTAATNAWDFLTNNPANIQYDHTGFENAEANRDSGEDLSLRALASAELFALTGDTIYRDYFDSVYDDPATADDTHQPINSGNFDTGKSLTMQTAMITYALCQNTTPSVVADIKNSLQAGINTVLNQNANDPYLSFMWDGQYAWGANSAKMIWAAFPLWGNKLYISPLQEEAFTAQAEEYLHFLHGRNPLSWVYLTGTAALGADKPITEIYHGWFHDGTAFDSNPAPGFLAGGPNQFFAPDSSYGGTIEPPQNQPVMKAYKDWNTSWPENSWEVTESAIYYQAKYTFVLAAFSAAIGGAAQPLAVEITSPADNDQVSGTVT